MIKTITFLIFLNFVFTEANSLEDYVISKTNEKFNLIKDYEVDMSIRVKIPKQNEYG